MPPSSYCKDAERGRRTEREQEEEEEEAGSNKRGQQKKGQNERKAGKEIRGGREEGAGEEMRNWTEGVGGIKATRLKLDKEGGKVRSGDSRRRRGLAVGLWHRSWGKKKRREERWRGGMESTLEDEVEIADADFHTSVPGATEGRQGAGRWRQGREMERGVTYG